MLLTTPIFENTKIPLPYEREYEHVYMTGGLVWFN
jgi:hypothetical protein